MSNERSAPVFAGDGPIALCLSGGGFRATFFHLGVVRLLKELNCLKRVTHVFSVSGGSILAAHLGLNWSDYTSSSTDVFQELSDELVRFGQHDLRGRIIRRWLLLQSRASTLQRQYDGFFKGARLQELPRTPRFYFLTTSMTTGRLCAFTREEFVVVHEDGDVVRFPAEAQPIAQAVAASSAFPPLFPPLELDLPDLPRAQFRNAEYLTDGGVFDNLGISRLHCLAPDAIKTGFAEIIVSDASALFDHAPASRFLWLPSRASRATDILMQRVASLESELRQQQLGGPLRVLRIADVVDDIPAGQMLFRPQPLKVQRLLKAVRTDFDDFDVDLIRALVKHGHEVAFQAAIGSTITITLDDYRKLSLSNANGHDKDVHPWDPCPAGWPDAAVMQKNAEQMALRNVALGSMKVIGRVLVGVGAKPALSTRNIEDSLTAADRKRVIEMETVIAGASKRPWMIWNTRDWASWILGLLAIGIIVAIVLGIFQIWRAIVAS